jgi:RNA polymerase sigma-70 factor (ECF subfamily)
MSGRLLRPADDLGLALEASSVTVAVEHLTDSELVERAVAGDPWAEEVLYRRYAALLLGVCTRLLRDRADAEDVVQDAFVDAFDQLGTLRNPGEFRRWLTGIAVHKVHRHFRRRKLLRALGLRRADQETSLESCLAAGLPAEHYAEVLCLDYALRQLPDAQRVAWQLRYLEGYRLEEVAEHCRCSLATIKRRIADADTLVRRTVKLEEDAS